MSLMCLSHCCISKSYHRQMNNLYVSVRFFKFFPFISFYLILYLPLFCLPHYYQKNLFYPTNTSKCEKKYSNIEKIKDILSQDMSSKIQISKLLATLVIVTLLPSSFLGADDIAFIKLFDTNGCQ